MDRPEPGVATVSVVIPTRNRAELLRRALASVLGQTHQRLEIIVVDDASSDNTAAVVTGVQDSRIRYLRHETNRGGAAARNTGIRAATGAVIGFLDDDDEWEPEKAEEQLKLLRDHHVVICGSDKSAELFRPGARETVRLDDLRKGRFTAGGTGVLMARAAVLKSIMFDESLPRYQDWDLFIRIAQRHAIVYLNIPLVRYNEGDHGRITNSLLKYRDAELERQFKMLHKHKEFFGPRWFRRHMSRALLYGIRHRQDKWDVVAYAVRRCGPLSACGAMSIRLRATLREKVDQFVTFARLPGRRSAT